MFNLLRKVKNSGLLYLFFLFFVVLLKTDSNIACPTMGKTITL